MNDSIPTVRLNARMGHQKVLAHTEHGDAWQGANLTQARKKAHLLRDAGHHVMVIGANPYYVAILNPDQEQ